MATEKKFEVGNRVRVKTALHGAIDKYADTESVVTRVAYSKKTGERYYYLHTDHVTDPLVYFFADELELIEPVADARDTEIIRLKAALEEINQTSVMSSSMQAWSRCLEIAYAALHPTDPSIEG